MFSKLDEKLLITFFIFILTLSGFLGYSYLKVKDIKIEREIVYDKIIKENFIPYKNKTIENIKENIKEINNLILSLKNDTIEYNNKLTFSTKIRLEYFDFYVKYKKEIKFIEFLARNNIYLTDFEKKIFLKRLNKNKKFENALNNKIFENSLNTYLARKNILGEKKLNEDVLENNSIEDKNILEKNIENNTIDKNQNNNSNNTIDGIDELLVKDNNYLKVDGIIETKKEDNDKSFLYSENKKQILFNYNKEKKLVKIIIKNNGKIQEDNENKKHTIYVGKLDFFNIFNEYIYDIKYIDDFKNNRTIGLIHSLGNDFKLKVHFFEIQYKKNGGIYRIINIDNFNNYIGYYRNSQCHYLLKYITIVDNKMKAYCYDYNLSKIIENDNIIVSDKD